MSSVGHLKKMRVSAALDFIANQEDFEPMVSRRGPITPRPLDNIHSISPPSPTVIIPTTSTNGARSSPWTGMMAKNLLAKQTAAAHSPNLDSKEDFPHLVVKQVTPSSPQVVSPISFNSISPTCNKKGYTVSPMGKACINMNRQYKCDQCESMIDSLSNLNSHIGSRRCQALAKALRPKPNIILSPIVDLDASEPISVSQQSNFIEISDDEEAEQTIPAVITSDEFICSKCGAIFISLVFFKKHQENCSPVLQAREICGNFQNSKCTLAPVETIMNGVLRIIDITPNEQSIISEQFINNTREGIQHVLKYCLDNGERVKVFSSTSVTMHKVNLADGTVDVEKTFFFNTKATPIQSDTDIDDFISKIQEKLDYQIDKFTNQGSNWVVASIDYVKISLVRYKLLRGGAENFIVPRELLSKKCILNIKVEGMECFKYAIIASLHHEEINDQHRHKNRKENYTPFIEQYDFSNINFPASANDICKFQKQNKDIAINALLYVPSEENKAASVVPIYHPPHSLAFNRRMATILLVGDHWLAVTNLNRLLSEQGETGARDHMAHCFRCLKNLYYPDRLAIHMKKCYNGMGQRVVMPSPEEAVHKFKDWSKMLSHSFVMYADMECILVKSDPPSKVLQIHVPCAVGSYLVPHKGLDWEQQPVRINEGVDCMKNFCMELDTLANEIYNFNQLQCRKPQIKTSESEAAFASKTCCEYCKSVFSDEVTKVWHHDHVSGEFLAALCQACNTKIRQPMSTLPVYFHNLKNYDMHALCLDGFSNMPNWILKPICLTKEKYITVTAKTVVGKDAAGHNIYFEIRFIDSYQFLTASLNTVSSSLRHADMKHVQFFRRHLNIQVDDDVIFSKGIFPYSYLDSWARLREVGLPALPAFYDTLKDCLDTTNEEYARAQKAYQQFNCQTFKDYLHKYLELDCYLLADVFENFRSTALANTGLDPSNYITLPQFTFSAAFRHTQCHLLTDVDMYEFFEDGIRGGMSFVNTHYVKADADTHISYWDENNLYAASLRQLLPTSDLRWLTEAEFNSIDWASIDTEGDVGYTLKVDLKYPAAIHDLTQDFPLAPETGMVTEAMLTPFMKEQWERRCEFRGGSLKYRPEKKLLMSCTDKKEYVVHFKLLKFYLNMGMQITTIHSVIGYKQTCIFKKYIDDNSARRQAATDEFTKDFYKLLNNALFGKTLENQRGRKEFKLRTRETQMLSDTSKPHYLSTHKFTKNLLINEMMNLEVKLNKPIFIGQAVLDLSKLIMYELRFVKLTSYAERFGGKIEILAGDTDSLFCSISQIDLHGQLHPAMLREGLLDSSNYPPEHPLFSNKHKAQLGCIKDEVKGEPVEEAVFLKPKCYSMKTVGGKVNKKRAKGVQFCVKERISHETFVQVFKFQEEIVRNTRRFDTNNHVVATISQNKWALSAVDTKRAWISANTSLPFGHYRLDGGVLDVGDVELLASGDAACELGEPTVKRPRLSS
jgi:hypothetical protein